MLRAYIGLGSNVRDRRKNLFTAISHIEKNHDCRVVQISSIYETEPVGSVKQRRFLNAVIEVESGLTVRQLFSALKDIERQMGREKTARWGPRIIDLDLLSIDSVSCNEPDLVVPHPELHRRRFVLVPFAEIAPDHVVPGLGKKVSALLPAVKTGNVDLFLDRSVIEYNKEV